MSVHIIFYENGAKHMRPVTTETEFRMLRNTPQQCAMVDMAREGDQNAKRRLVQFNYSCLPAEGGLLKGATQMTTSVGMDVDFDKESPDYETRMREVPSLILAKKDELGLLMLERSASKGYHIVFRRRPDLNQEDNLRWASSLLGVQYDEGAKDITRVFFATTASETDLLFLDDALFANENARRDAENAESLSSPVATGPVILNGVKDLGTAQPITAGCQDSSSPEASQNDIKGNVILNGVKDLGTAQPIMAGCQDSSSPEASQNDIKGNVILNGVKDLSRESVHPADAAGAQRDSSSARSSVVLVPYAAGDAAPADSPDCSRTLPQNDITPVGGEKYDGIPYSLILQEWWNLTNSGKQPVKSNRDALTYELAVNLRNICGFDRNVLNQVIPCYDEFPEAEKMKCIDSALQSARTQMPSRLKQAINNARKKMGEESEDSTVQDNNLFAFLRGETPPTPPKRLPSLLALLTSNVADRQVATTAMSVFPALGAHLSGVTIRDTDNVSLEPAFMHLQIARSSSGKSCINQPIDMIVADIRESDRKARDERREWAKTCKKLGANKEKPPRPTACIQLADINMTAAALTQMLFDADQAGGKGLYTRMDEIEMLSDLGAGNNTGNRGVSKILRLGYDHAEWGQERVGVDSVCERAPLRWFWNASGTVKRCYNYLANSIADGTLSRITLSTILERGSRPVYGEYDQEFADKLKPYILRLSAANGEVRCPQAERVARRLSEEITVYLDTLLDDDDVVSSWAPRAATMALMRAIVLYIAQGYQWSKEIENFMTWSYEYDLWCKFHFFGEAAEREMSGEVVSTPGKPGPKGVLSQMSGSFTLDELDAKVKALGCHQKAKKLLGMWKLRKLVTIDDETGLVHRVG